MIPISSELDSETRRLIESEIGRLVTHPPADARSVIIGRLPKLVKALKANPSPFRSRLVLAAKSFFDIYAETLKRGVASGRTAYSAKCKIAIAALYYFCEVQDVIPDYDPVSGFDDDAYAFNCCVAKMKELDTAWYRRVTKALE